MAAIQPAVNSSFPIGPVTISTSDSTTYLTPPLRQLRAGVAGDIVIVNHAGDTVTIKAAQAGEKITGTFQKVKSTSTTATDIIGWY